MYPHNSYELLMNFFQNIQSNHLSEGEQVLIFFFFQLHLLNFIINYHVQPTPSVTIKRLSGYQQE